MHWDLFIIEIGKKHVSYGKLISASDVVSSVIPMFMYLTKSKILKKGVDSSRCFFVVLNSCGVY